MAKRPHELHDPVVVEIEDEFSTLPADEQARRTAAWLRSLAEHEPVELPVSGAKLLAESRAEIGW